MKPFLLATIGLAFAAGAMAQTPPPPPGGGDRDAGMSRPDGSPPPRGRRDRMERPGREDRRDMHHMMGMSKAAHFHFERGDAKGMVKCPDDETMKACVDATMTLLDKFSTSR